MASAFQKLLFLTKKKNKTDANKSSKFSIEPQSKSHHHQSYSYQQQPILTTSSLNSASGSINSNKGIRRGNGSSTSIRNQNRPRASTLDSSTLLSNRNQNQVDEFGSLDMGSNQDQGDGYEFEDDQDEEEDDPDSNPIYQTISNHSELREDWKQTSLVILPSIKYLDRTGKNRESQNEHYNDNEEEEEEKEMDLDMDWRENLTYSKSHCFFESQDVKEKWVGINNEINQRNRIEFLDDLGKKKVRVRQKEKYQDCDWEKLFLEISIELLTQDSKVCLEITYLSPIFKNDELSNRSEFELKTIRRTLKVIGEITVYPTPLPTFASTSTSGQHREGNLDSTTTTSTSTPVQSRRSTISGFEVLSRDSHIREKKEKEKESQVDLESSTISNQNQNQNQNQSSMKRKPSKKWRVKVLNVDGLMIPTTLKELEKEWKEQQIQDGTISKSNSRGSNSNSNSISRNKDFQPSNSNPSSIFNPPSPTHSIVFPSKPLPSSEKEIPVFSDSPVGIAFDEKKVNDKKSDFGELGLKGISNQGFGKGRRNSSPLLSRMDSGGNQSLTSQGERDNDDLSRIGIANLVPKLLLDLHSLLVFSPRLLEIQSRESSKNRDLSPTSSPMLDQSNDLTTEQLSSLRSLTRSTLSKLLKSRDSLSSFVYIHGFEEYCKRKAEEKIFKPCLDSFLEGLEQFELDNASSSKPLSIPSLANLKSNMRSILRNLSEGLMFAKFYYPIKKNLELGDYELNQILKTYGEFDIGFKELGIEKTWKTEEVVKNSSFSNVQDYFSAFNHRDQCPETNHLGLEVGVDGKKDSGEILKVAISMTRTLGIERGLSSEDEDLENQVEDPSNSFQIQTLEFLNNPFGLESSISNLIARVEDTKSSSKGGRVQFLSKDVHTPSEMISTFQNLIKEIGNSYTRLSEKPNRSFNPSRVNSRSSSYSTQNPQITVQGGHDQIESRSNNNLQLSPDDLFPTIAYLIIKSGCMDLVSKLAYIKAFGNEELENEQRWALTTFDLVVEWLRTDPLASQIASRQPTRKSSNASQLHRTTSIGSQRSIGAGPDSSHSHSNSNSSSQVLSKSSYSNKPRSNNASHIRSLSPRPSPAIFKDGNWSSSTDLLEVARPSSSRSNSFIRDSNANRERRISLPLSNSHFNKSGDSLGVGSDEGHHSSSGSINTFKLPSHPASATRRIISGRSNNNPRPGSFLLESVGEGIASSVIDERPGESQVRSSSSASRSTGDLLNQQGLVGDGQETSPKSESLRSTRLDGSGGSSVGNHFSNSHSRATSLTTMSSNGNPSSPTPSFGSSSELQIRPQIIVRPHKRPMTSSGGGLALERSGSEISSRSLNNHHHHAPPKTRIVGSSSNSSTGSSWSQIMSRTLSDRPSSPNVSNPSNDSEYSNSDSVSGIAGTITPKSVRPKVHPRRKSLDSWTALNMFSSMSLFPQPSSNEVAPSSQVTASDNDKNQSSAPQVLVLPTSSSGSSFGFNTSLARSASDSNSDSQSSIKTPPPDLISQHHKIRSLSSDGRGHDPERRISYSSIGSASPNITAVSNPSNSSSRWFYSFLAKDNHSSKEHPTSASESGSSMYNEENIPTSSTMSRLPRSISNSGSISGFSSIGSVGGYEAGGYASSIKEKRNSIIDSSPSTTSSFRTSFPSVSSSESPKHVEFSTKSSQSASSIPKPSHRRTQTISAGNPSNRLRLLSNSSLAPPKLQRLEAAAENSTQSPTTPSSENASPLLPSFLAE